MIIEVSFFGACDLLTILTDDLQFRRTINEMLYLGKQTRFRPLRYTSSRSPNADNMIDQKLLFISSNLKA